MRYEKEITLGGDDCRECCFYETCCYTCRLDIGWHWRDTQPPGAADC